MGGGVWGGGGRYIVQGETRAWRYFLFLFFFSPSFKNTEKGGKRKRREDVRGKKGKGGKENEDLWSRDGVRGLVVGGKKLEEEKLEEGRGRGRGKREGIYGLVVLLGLEN